MENLEKMIQLADNEFSAISQNGKFKSREEIHSAYELMDIAKDAMEIMCMMEELGGGEEGMSSRGGSYYRDGRGGSNRGGSYYEDGGSYYERRGRGRNASRDSRGRYNEGGSYREGSYRDGSYRDGGMMRRGGGSYYREGGKEEFAMELKELMQDAPDEQSRQSIQQILQQMGQG